MKIFFKTIHHVAACAGDGASWMLKNTAETAVEPYCDGGLG